MPHPHALTTLAAALIGASTLASAQQKPAPPEHMQHRFEDADRYAKSFDDPARDAWQMPDRVIAALKLPSDASVADIGAGTGYFSVRLAKAVAKGTVYAVDIEPGMLAHITKRAAAEKLGNIVTVQATAGSPKLPTAVDAVVVVDTYHHIPARPAYFRALKASLKPGGRVAIVDFRKDSPSGPPPEFRFEAAQIVREMEEAGYALATTHEFLPRQHFLEFAPAVR
jgi:cyclopropane fatty-acyl-phospholipid synthase-like methyltransferase